MKLNFKYHNNASSNLKISLLVKFLVSILLIGTFVVTTGTSKALAAPGANCNSVTGGNVQSLGSLWIFTWDPIDTTNVSALNIFVKSGAGSLPWYNNVSGYFWNSALKTATQYNQNKTSLISFMNDKEITTITFIIRKEKDGDPLDICFPESTLGTLNASDIGQLSKPTNLVFTQVASNSAKLSFDSDGIAASNTVILTPVDGGTTVTVANFVSGQTITGLQPSTKYNVQIKSLGGIAKLSNISDSVELNTISSSPTVVLRYKLLYDPNGLNVSSMPFEPNFYQAGQIVKISTQKPSRENYIFKGWNSKEDSSGNEYLPGESYSFKNQDLVLYANWQINVYRINLVENGSSASSISYDSSLYKTGSKINIPDQVPTRVGYTFQSWNSKVDGSGVVYSPGESYTFNNQDLTLYATWKINVYKIAFEGNGIEKTGIPTINKNFGENILMPELPITTQRPGYTFSGWTASKDGEGKIYASGSTFVVGASDVTFYAIWKVNKYLISFDANGAVRGSIPLPSVRDFGSTVIIKSTISAMRKNGYFFNGWNTSPDGTGVTYKVGETFQLGAGDLKLYALWQPKTYNIAFYSSGSRPQLGGVFVSGGSISDPGNPSPRPGYIFKGWSINGVNQSLVTFPYKPNLFRPISFFAVWQKL